MNKFFNGLFLTVLLLIIIGGSGYFGYIFAGHNGHTNMNTMNNTIQAPSNNVAVDGTHNMHNSSIPQIKPYNLFITNKPASTTLTDDVQNINTPAMKKEPELTNVAFIDYIVNPADTLSRISKTYMPDFPAYDTDDTIGIITYIAEKNKLKKGLNGEYIIYYGRKLNIPAQLSVVSKIIRPSNKDKANTNHPAVNTPSKKESIPQSQTDSSSHNGGGMNMQGSDDMNMQSH